MLARPLLTAAALAVAVAAAPAPKSAWDITMTTIDGRPMPLAAYKGKVLLVVNTASRCGFTPQYEGLQKLQTSYAAKGFTVVGVPSGDFGGQELSDNGKIKQFCQTTFGINFPLAEKSTVTGPRAAPFFRWATATLGPDSVPQWNFHKYLVGRNGKLVGYYGSKVEPQSKQLTAAIEGALGAD